MSDENTGIETPIEETPPEAIQTATVEPAEETHEEAVELKPGEKYVPLSALMAVRNENKALKPQAAKAAELESQLNELRPYADFVKANPQLLQPRQEPAPPPDPTKDPAIEQYARRFDLYTADGKPDVERAKAIIDDNRAVAREEANKLLEPVRNETLAQRAVANVTWMTQQKDAAGNPLAQEHIDAVVRSITGQMTKAQALKVLADPAVVQVTTDTAWGRQARSARPVAQKPPGEPLHVETAGGGQGVPITDASRRLAKSAGISDKDFEASAKKFQPGKYNRLED